MKYTVNADKHRFEVGDKVVTNPDFPWSDRFDYCPKQGVIYEVHSVTDGLSSTGQMVSAVAENMENEHAVLDVSSEWFFPLLEWK